MYILIAAGLLLALLGFFWLSHIVTNRKGLGWGLLVFIAPPVSFVFSAVYWEKARYCVATTGFGTILLAIAIYFNGVPSAIAQIRNFGMDGTATNLESMYVSAQQSISGFKTGHDEETVDVALVSDNKNTEQEQHFISKYVFKKLPLSKINNYSNHNIDITLNSGKKQTGILIERNRSEILIKRRMYSGSMTYAIKISDIYNIKVQIPQKIKA